MRHWDQSWGNAAAFADAVPEIATIMHMNLQERVSCSKS